MTRANRASPANRSASASSTSAPTLPVSGATENEVWLTLSCPLCAPHGPHVNQLSNTPILDKQRSRDDAPRRPSGQNRSMAARKGNAGDPTTRNALLDAAQRVMLAEGYAGATTRRVAS